MAADLCHRSYISSTLLNNFLEDVPEVTHENVLKLHKKNECEVFIATCTREKKSAAQGSSESNEKEFTALIQCIASLDGLNQHFRKVGGNTQNGNPRWGCIRISHQGNTRMTTWNPKARWLRENAHTAKPYELKPDLMAIVVEDTERARPREAQQKYVQPAKPQTILPPPDDWKPERMVDMNKNFPIVECKEPV
jgi:hypothetical protein